jgi:hypothetical protein
MPPKKTKKATKPKKGKGKTTKMSQVQTTRVNVRVGMGGGGSGVMSAPIVYATYAPPPPTQPSQIVFDNGLPPTPDKQKPRNHSSTGVNHAPKYPVRPRPHQGMSPMDKFLFDSEASFSYNDSPPQRAASEPQRAASPSMKSEPQRAAS